MSLKSRPDILRLSNFECDDFETERTGCCLGLSHLQHRSGIANVGQDRQAPDAREDLPQESKPLARNIGGLER